MITHVTWLIRLEEMLYNQANIRGPTASLDGFSERDASKGSRMSSGIGGAVVRFIGMHIGVDVGVADYQAVEIEFEGKMGS